MKLMIILVFGVAAALSLMWVRVAEAFPEDGIVPKGEIGADRFLTEHPEYDGRGVVVAIFDTGVDPGAVGLGRTPDGGPKLIDIVDATGSGDVRMGEPVKIVDGVVTGRSGRTLRVGNGWTVRDQEVRLGLKAGWELFPSRLVGRLKAKRREAWDAAQWTRMRELQAAVDGFKKEHPKPEGEEKETFAELEARLSMCGEMGNAYDDPGPVLDCVLFHDGERWRAVVDTDEDGDLEEEKVLSEYDVAQEFATFGKEDLLNFGIHVYEAGKVLSLVVDSGTHGTHVAGIVGGYYPGDPARNGIAPGVRMVSVKIGDTRLGSMETSHALRRAIAAARAHTVDLVNLSYGEPTRTPNGGALIEELKELVYEDGIVFVAAAGNEGPALSTVGAPGGTTSACIGVGAYLSPAVMRAGHSFLREMPGTQYTWSSRGPTQDGDLGVDISAPGGAIAPVPRWALAREQFMNGTSMASPNACGGLALVLSGLKALGVPYSPTTVKRSIAVTADRIDDLDAFAQGHGMLQIDRAFEWLRSLPPEERAWPRFEVAVGDGRGVYLRGGAAAGRKQTIRARVSPHFPKSAPRSALADFQTRVVVRSTVPWIAAPGFFMASSDAKTLEIEVDPTGLEAGAHFGEVVGFAAGRDGMGPLFRVPVTVVKPMDVGWGGEFEWTGEFEFEAGALRRLFFDLPDGATWAELEVRGLALDGSRRLVAHVQHAGPHEAHRNMGRSFEWTLDGETRDRQRGTFAVRGGDVMEICLAQNWSSPGTGRYEARLRLHGTAAHASESQFLRGTKSHAIAVVSRLRAESIAPSARLSAYRRTVAPSTHFLRARIDDSRDAMRDGRAVHELVLEYKFAIREPAKITPRFPALNDRVYETDYESQLQQLLDVNRRLIAVDDTYPGGFDLKQGEYVLRLHLRHAERDKLERLDDLAVVLEFALAKPLDLPVYAHADHALAGSPAGGAGVLAEGRWMPLFLGEPDWKALPETCVDGDTLVGALVLQRDAPEALPLACMVRGGTTAAEAAGQKEKKDKKDEIGEKDEEGARADALVEVRREALGSLLRKKKLVEFDSMAAAALEASPDDVATRLLVLQRHTGEPWREHTAEVLAAAEAVIGKIDEAPLAAYFGMRHDDGEPASAEKEMKETREALTTALAWTVRAQIASKAEYDATLQQLRKWADISQKSFDEMNRERFAAEKRWGRLLALIHRGDMPKKVDARQRLEIFRELGWDHWVESEERRLLRAYPDEDPPF